MQGGCRLHGFKYMADFIGYYFFRFTPALFFNRCFLVCKVDFSAIFYCSRCFGVLKQLFYKIKGHPYAVICKFFFRHYFSLFLNLFHYILNCPGSHCVFEACSRACSDNLFPDGSNRWSYPCCIGRKFIVALHAIIAGLFMGKRFYELKNTADFILVDKACPCIPDSTLCIDNDDIARILDHAERTGHAAVHVSVEQQVFFF